MMHVPIFSWGSSITAVEKGLFFLNISTDHMVQDTGASARADLGIEKMLLSSGKTCQARSAPACPNLTRVVGRRGIDFSVLLTTHLKFFTGAAFSGILFPLFCHLDTSRFIDFVSLKPHYDRIPRWFSVA
jgi:hypothetical protein